METTYSATVGDVNCAYYVILDTTTGKLLLNLCVDFSIVAHIVMIMQMLLYLYIWEVGTTISKRERRTGQGRLVRHLICIEDPIEISHDLGRVVDKHSIKVLREEFERAADIMQYDPNPCVKLFEPYVPS